MHAESGKLGAKETRFELLEESLEVEIEADFLERRKSRVLRGAGAQRLLRGDQTGVGTEALVQDRKVRDGGLMLRLEWRDARIGPRDELGHVELRAVCAFDLENAADVDVSSERRRAGGQRHGVLPANREHELRLRRQRRVAVRPNPESGVRRSERRLPFREIDDQRGIVEAPRRHAAHACGTRRRAE